MVVLLEPSYILCCENMTCQEEIMKTWFWTLSKIFLANCLWMSGLNGLINLLFLSTFPMKCLEVTFVRFELEFTSCKNVRYDYEISGYETQYDEQKIIHSLLFALHYINQSESLLHLKIVLLTLKALFVLLIGSKCNSLFCLISEYICITYHCLYSL
jgi:hypothetical protein